MKALALFFVCGIFSFSGFATVSETTCSNSDGSIVLVVDGALEVNNSSVTAIRGEDVSLVETKSEIEVVVDDVTSVAHILLRSNGRDLTDDLFLCEKVDV